MNRISESTHYEAYFDLWGFSFPWIKAIQNAMHELCECSEGDECEAYTCEACMAVRFTSMSRDKIQMVKAKFKQLESLAKRTMKSKDPNKIYYHHP